MSDLLDMLSSAITKLEIEAYQHGLRAGSANGTATYDRHRVRQDNGAPHMEAQAEILPLLAEIGRIVLTARRSGIGDNEGTP